MFLSSCFTYADRFVQMVDVPNLIVYVKLRIINEYSHFLKWVEKTHHKKSENFIEYVDSRIFIPYESYYLSL